MRTTALFTGLLLTLFSFHCTASCTEECKTAYDECIAEHPSPNGEKICGTDYNDCKMQCVERGESDH